jgi:tRNA (guanine-N7-)-methyltransferase
MGRRSLRKVNPSLDLSKYLKTLDQLPRPWNAPDLFGREAPLEVEMGSGKGLFLASAATERPEHNFLGVEVAHRYARFAAARLAGRGLTNALVVSGDGLALFRELLPDRSLAAIHVYFPDPWWKKRHKKRRVMNEAFLADVERTLAPEGQLHFWTDVEEYYQGTLALIAQITRLEGPFEVPAREATHDLDYRTHFERRMRLHDLPVYRSLFVKFC